MRGRVVCFREKVNESAGSGAMSVDSSGWARGVGKGREGQWVSKSVCVDEDAGDGFARSFQSESVARPFSSIASPIADPGPAEPEAEAGDCAVEGRDEVDVAPALGLANDPTSVLIFNPSHFAARPPMTGDGCMMLPRRPLLPLWGRPCELGSGEGGCDAIDAELTKDEVDAEEREWRWRGADW